MSTAYYGRIVPVALRRFHRVACWPLEKTASATCMQELPRDLPPGMHFVVFLTRLKHVYHLDSWLNLRRGLDTVVKRKWQENEEAFGIEAKKRRVEKVKREQEGAASSSTAFPSTACTTAAEDKDKITAYPDSQTQGNNEMRMYIVGMLPIFPPTRLLWHFFMRRWREKLRRYFLKDHDEGRAEDEEKTRRARSVGGGREPSELEKIEFRTTVTWRSGYFKEMKLHEDGRAWAFLVKNDGEILWCSDEDFDDPVGDKWKGLQKAVDEEFGFREKRLNALIGDGGGAEKKAITAGDDHHKRAEAGEAGK
eukprot:g7540.t1